MGSIYAVTDNGKLKINSWVIWARIFCFHATLIFFTKVSCSIKSNAFLKSMKLSIARLLFSMFANSSALYVSRLTLLIYSSKTKLVLGHDLSSKHPTRPVKDYHWTWRMAERHLIIKSFGLGACMTVKFELFWNKCLMYWYDYFFFHVASHSGVYMIENLFWWNVKLFLYFCMNWVNVCL